MSELFRIGDTDKLPSELISQLSKRARSQSVQPAKRENQIIRIMNERFGGTAHIDELMVALWEENGIVEDREELRQFLYRTRRKNLWRLLPGNKCTFTTKKKKPNPSR